MNLNLRVTRRGNDVVLTNDKNMRHQRFFFDGKTQCIKPESAIDLCLDGSTSEKPGSKLRFNRGNGSWGQKFKYDGTNFNNERYLVIDIDPSADRNDDSHKMRIMGKSRKQNQQFIIQYL